MSFVKSITNKLKWSFDCETQKEEEVYDLVNCIGLNRSKTNVGYKKPDIVTTIYPWLGFLM